MAKIKIKKLKKSRNVSRVEAEYFLELYNQIGSFQDVAEIADRDPKTVSKWVKILQAEQTIHLSLQTQ